MIVRWSVRWGATPDMTALRVLRPMGTGALFLASTASETVTTDKQRFAASLPIGIGDRIAVDDFAGGGGPRGTNSDDNPIPGGVIQTWLDSPANGEFAEPTGSNNPPNTELLLNAEIEPTSDAAITRVKKNKKKGTAVAKVSLPNPGTLVVHSKLVKGKTIEATAPGPLQITLHPKKKTRKRLGRKGKAAAPVTFTYTPNFGTATVDTARVGLKLRRKK